MERKNCFCNTCQGETEHEILHHVRYSKDLGVPDDICMYYNYKMLQCCGCKSVVLQKSSHFSEDADDDVTVELFPPKISRKPPPWLEDLRREHQTRFVYDLLKEVYIAVQNDMRRLAVMGIRSVFERVMTKSVRRQMTFNNLLVAFAKKEQIPRNQVKILKAVLGAGHATVHRAYQPSIDDLNICIDATESIIQNAFILPKKAVELKKRVPKRRRITRTKKKQAQ